MSADGEEQPPQIGEIGLVHAHARELAREPFQCRHHFEGMTDIFRRQGHHLGTAIGELHQKPVRRQHAESLPQRRARHAQPLAQLPLVEACARRQIAFDDQCTEALRRRLGQRQSGDWEIRSVHGWTHCGILYTKCNTALQRGVALSEAR